MAPGELPLIYLACRRHKLERDMNSVWKSCFPGPTKAPADAMCEKVHKLVEVDKLPSELDDSCPFIFREESPFFDEQRNRLEFVTRWRQQPRIKIVSLEMITDLC